MTSNHRIVTHHSESFDSLVLLSGSHWKIADFGFATPGNSYPAYSTEGRGTNSYRAPELIRFSQFTRKVDIWAIGCILYEMVTGRVLFSDDFYVRQYAENNFQLELPELPWTPHAANDQAQPQAFTPAQVYTQAQVRQSFEECLNRHASARPTAQNLLSRFQTILASLQ